jgi:alkyl hydroperoxide reductase subunit AhpC
MDADMNGQIPSYEVDKDRFDGVNAQVLGVSVDSVPSLQAWAESLVVYLSIAQ